MANYKGYAFSYDIQEMEKLKQEYPIFRTNFTKAIRNAIEAFYPLKTNPIKKLQVEINKRRKIIEDNELLIKQYNIMIDALNKEAGNNE